MIRWWLPAVIALVLVAGATAAGACEPTPDRHAVPIAAQEVTGEVGFTWPLGDGLVFALVPQEYGWSIRILDGDDPATAADLSAVTPPFGGPANPRDLSGWHFRNAANTGPNLGDVNAPQTKRSFFFHTGPPPTDPRHTPPDPDDGHGWLEILDFELADLEPGQRARFTSLRFDACISWPRSATAGDGSFTPEDLEIFGSCGLDLASVTLDAAFPPAVLQGDLDGDGSFDHVAQIRRRADGKRGLAICRAGTWLHVLGLDGRTVGEALRPGWFDQMEAWRLVDRNHGGFGYVDEPSWPRSDGDVLVLERIEKEMILLYWRDGGLRSQQVYRFVEP